MKTVRFENLLASTRPWFGAYAIRPAPIPASFPAQQSEPAESGCDPASPEPSDGAAAAAPTEADAPAAQPEAVDAAKDGRTRCQRARPPNRPRQPRRPRRRPSTNRRRQRRRRQITRHRHRQGARPCRLHRKAERDGVEQFYKARDYKPLWLTNGAADDRAKAAIAYLAQVDSVGLDPSDYPAPDFAAATTPDALAEAEIKLTEFRADLRAPGADRPHPFTRASPPTFSSTWSRRSRPTC